MDLAYDHVQEAVIEGQSATSVSSGGGGPGLNEEFTEAYKAISNSPWGMKFGAFVGNVRKQGESYYEASKTTVASTATRGFTDLKSNIVNRARSLSLTQAITQPSGVAGSVSAAAQKQQQQAPQQRDTGEVSESADSSSKSAPAAVADQEGFISKLKADVAKGISEIERAEAKADEYLIKWGSTIGNFLKEAVTIAPPEGEEFAEESVGGARGGGGGEVLFETKGGAQGAQGEDGAKRQIYTTRLDAQLHLLHSSLDLFRHDPAVESYSKDWISGFDVENRTEKIAADLEKYPELRATMENLVPAEVGYVQFWQRYYFLRAELDAEEQKRKDLLKGALEEEEVGWGSDEEEDEEGDEAEGEAEDDDEDDDEEEEENEEEDDDDEEEEVPAKPVVTQRPPRPQASTETLQAKPRTSADRTSQPDSDTSYDIVSGAPSNATSQAGGGSPTNKKPVDDDSDEDWE